MNRGSRLVRRRRLHRASLLTTSFWLIASTAATSLLGLLFWTAVARSMPAGSMGTACVEIAIAGLVSQIAVVGLAPITLQGVAALACPDARARLAGRMIHRAAVAGLVGAAMLQLIRAGVLLYPPEHGHTVAVLLVAIAIPPVAAAGGVFDAACIAERRAVLVLIHNTGASLLKPVLLALLLAGGMRGPLPIILAWAGAGLLALPATAALAYRRRYRPYWWGISDAGHGGKDAGLRTAAVQQLIGLGGCAWPQLNPVLISLRLSPAASAYVAAAWMAGGMLFTLSASLAAALLAEGARTPKRLAGALRHAVLAVLILVPAAGLLFCAAGPLVLACFGPEYVAWSTSMLPVLALAALPDACTNLALAVYRACGAWSAAIRLNLLMPLVALVLAWCWVPCYGPAGDAWAWFAGQSAGAGLVLVHLWRVRHRVFGARRHGLLPIRARTSFLFPHAPDDR